MPKTRKDSSVYLIGHYDPQIIGGKLPSNRDVLKVPFFNVREVNLSVEASADLVISEVFTLWNKARIPTRATHHCASKLVKLYNEWRNLEKSKYRNFPKDKKKRGDFLDMLDDLFDIAHENALKMIKIEDDRKFLISQRQKGRPGFMYGVDWDLHRKEIRAQERKEKQIARETKNAESLEKAAETCILESSKPGSEDESIPKKPCTSSGTKRSTRNIVTPRVAAALDKCRLSDRNALHVIASVVEASGLDPSSFSLNRTSLQRARKQHHIERTNNLRENFGKLDLQVVTIHWDGKMFTFSRDQQKYDRIAIVITSGDVEKILCFPEIGTSTGKDQAEAIFEALMDWGLEELVKMLCCDTTSSNLGRFKGAAIIVELFLGRDILYLPCRHHIFELVLAGAFFVKMPASKGPEVVLFKRFKKFWLKIKKEKFKTALEDEELRVILEKYRLGILEFTEKILSLEEQPRDDYREFLILTQIFLGKVDRKTTFSPPGPMHSARWMAKAIYCLKINLFREQFEMQEVERKGVRDLCVFIVTVYVKAWFTAPLAVTMICNL